MDVSGSSSLTMLQETVLEDGDSHHSSIRG